MKHLILSAAVLAALALSHPAVAADGDRDANGWSGTGELGLAMARGNARSENLNAKLDFKNEDDQWKHHFYVSALRAKGEVVGDFDGDGILEERFELNANRYTFGASSALKMNEISYWVAALRYENDDFAPFESQATFSLGYGRSLIKNERTDLTMEVGPGWRHAKSAAGWIENEAILRGLLDFKHKLTDNTDLVNTLLIESGNDNTFVQNDLGVAVKMNDSFALKAGLQARHNTDVLPGQKKTDTLTTVNLVYNFQ